MAKFSPQFIDRVRQANPIVDVIGEHVALKKSGKNFKACCPFHNEKTPSFMVAADKDIFKCFGCGKGGNVFSFIMEYNGVSFPEAVELLANRTGIPLEVEGSNRDAVEFAAQRRQQKQRLYSLCQLALAFFEKMLSSPAGKSARTYIQNRNISEEAVRAFRLGYAPDEWDALLRTACADGYKEEELVLTGLAVRHEEKNSYYDRFRNRLMFPIWDLAGNVIAFGGRVLDTSEPKYLNSPETPIYVKSKVLYPINLTRRAIQQKGCAILCEGYMDALTLAQYRFTHTVASCGTALTAEQAHLLKRFTGKVIMAYDGDAAGQDATLRSISVLVEQNIDVYVAPLQGGDDPDSFLKANGPEAFNQLIDNAVPFFPYLLQQLGEKIDRRSPHGQQALCDRVFPLLNRFDSEILLGGYLDQLSRYMTIDRDRLGRQFARYRRQHVPPLERRKVNTGETPAPVKLSPAEEHFLAMITRDDQVLSYALKNLDISYIEHPLAHEVIQNMYDASREGTWHGVEVFLSTISDDEAALVTTALARVPETPENWKRAMDDCIKALHNHSYDTEIARLKSELNRTSSPEEIDNIMKRIRSYQQLKRKQNRINKLNIHSTV